jgi:capsule polysaccharide export protein KpsE/RkpR
MVSLISIILRYKKIVAIVTAAAFVVSALVSLLIPPRFFSSASLLPLGVEQDISGLRDFFSSFGAYGEAAAGILRGQKNLVIDYFIGSRRMSDLLSERFDLAEIYDTKDPEEIRRRLRKHTSILIREEGVIVLGVEDRSPHRAKEMVEAYIANLDTILIGFAIENAEQRVAYLTEERARRKRRLLEADTVMQRFQTEYGIYQIEEQARAALEIASRLSARLSMLNVETKLLEMTLQPASPELERMKLELGLLEQQLLALKENEGVLYPSLDDFPDIASRHIRLLADRRVQEFVLAYVGLQLEEARIAAGRRLSAVKIIDPPFLPERRVWPKRKQIVIVSTLVVFFWTCFALLVRERWREGAFRHQMYAGEPKIRPPAVGSESEESE